MVKCNRGVEILMVAISILLRGDQLLGQGPGSNVRTVIVEVRAGVRTPNQVLEQLVLEQPCRC